MQSQDLHPGHKYVLQAGTRQRVVTVLPTSPELRRRARVRVEFQEGVKAGNQTAVPTRGIIAALTGPAVGASKHPGPPAADRSPRVWRDPVRGDQVTMDATGLIWTVQEISGVEAVIHTVIMERPTTNTVPVERLRVLLPEHSRPVAKPSPTDELQLRRLAAELARSPDPDPDPSVVAEPAPSSRAPEQPHRMLDECLEATVFSPACIAQYRRRFHAKGSDAQVLDQMRERIRRHGYLVDDEPLGVGEFAVMRVPHRFDVVLHSRPTAEQSVRVDDLRFARGRGRQARSKRAA